MPATCVVQNTYPQLAGLFVSTRQNGGTLTVYGPGNEPTDNNICYLYQDGGTPIGLYLKIRLGGVLYQPISLATLLP